VAFDQFYNPCIGGDDYFDVIASEAWYVVRTAVIDGLSVVPTGFIAPSSGAGNVSGVHAFAGAQGELTNVEFFWTSDDVSTGVTYIIATYVPGMECAGGPEGPLN
jgi:hypothetical protein